MTSLARAIYSTVRAIPKALNDAGTDADLAIIALELERARKALYGALDGRRHRRWTARGRGVA